MLIAGWRAFELKRISINDECCPICKHNVEITITLNFRLYYFFFIPFIPDSRYVVALCSHCNEELSEADLGPRYRHLLKTKNHKEKAPLRSWTGFILLVTLLAAYYTYPHL